MKTYIGTKIIQGEPAVRKGGRVYGEGEAIPRSVEPVEEGYKVVYPDGYVSWSPKAVFEAAYRLTDGMSFGLAIEAAKQGKRIKRRGWNGKNQYVEMAKNISYVASDGSTVNVEHYAIGNKAFAFCGTSGVQMGWLASQADMLADDWEVMQ